MPVFTSSIEVTADYPTIKPSLNLNFARSRSLDPRITFTRASVGTYVGRDGLVKTAGENEPRFDHDPDTLESLGLLLEDTRTNIFANNHDPASGASGTATKTTVQIVLPSGETGSALETDANDFAENYRNLTATANTNPGHLTFYAKKKTSGSTGTLTVTLEGGGTGRTFGSFSINSDTWTKITHTHDWSSSNATLRRFDAYLQTANSSDSDTSFYLAFIQFEEGSFPTSYIPTSGSAATRARDDATIVGESFNSFYNQNEGSLFVESTPMYVASGINHRVCVITGDSNFTTSSAPGGINVDYEGTTLRTELFSGSPNSAQQGSGLTVSAGNKNKLAYGLETNNVSVIVNGTQVGSTDTSAPMPDPMTKMGIGRRPDINTTYADGIHISSIQYYSKRLTNAQLQLLTS